MSQTYHGALPVGSRIESYEIAAVLGVGGFGITYKGYDHSLHCDVAIKEYLPHGLALRQIDGTTVIPKSDTDKKYYDYGLKRFLEEARILAKFKEASIVRVSRFLETNGTAYLVMDYEEGESLAQYLQRAGVLREDEIRAIAVPITHGLRAVHAKDFLHRDIKPGNIYLRKDGPPVLLDFGAARQALGEHTRALTGMVTPGYAPFEQYQSRAKQGPWTDVYALGATLYHCISGKAPIEAPDRIAAQQDDGDDPMMPAIEAGRGRYTPDFLALIDWMLAPRPKDRPQTVDAILARLEPVESTPPPLNELPRTQVATQPLDAERPVRTTPPVTRDELEAFKACHAAAERGDADALYRLGVMHAHGRGTARDEARAVHCLRQSAEQGVVMAQTRLALMLARGAGVEKNEAEAADWFRRAADHGDVVAQFNLGIVHAHGLGVSRNPEQAAHWYRQAAAQGHAGARVNLQLIDARRPRRHYAWMAGAAVAMAATAAAMIMVLA